MDTIVSALKPGELHAGDASKSAIEAVGNAASLADALRYLRQVTDGSSDQLILLDCDLHVLFANRANYVHSDRVASLTGCHICELLPSRGRELALACLRRVLHSGVADCFEVEFGSNDGRASDRSENRLDNPNQANRYQEIRIAPVREGGRIVALALNASDTTQHVLAQRAVATQAKMIESMLEGVALIDASDDIVITNPAFDALFGFKRGLLIGWPLAQLAQAANFELERLQVGHKGSGPWAVEFEAQRQDGRAVSLAGALSRLRDAAGEHRLLVLQDVSERKLLERAMLEAVSHEQYRIGNDLHDGLGQELTGIALMLRCLAGRLAVEHRQMLPDVEGITRLVSNAVESTRSLARGLSPVNLERGGLRDALAGLAMHARSVYGIKAVFTNRIRPNMQLSVELANHLYRIAQEAVTNAVKHGHAKTVRLQLSSARRCVRLTIADDGGGMPADVHASAGLGLRIMRYRARIARGDLHFENTAPHGTRVICECPLDQPSLPTRANTRRTHERPAQRAASHSTTHSVARSTADPRRRMRTGKLRRP